ncbi:hypothetical protein [Paraburkholderia rhizosphaerae]|uniref:Uncharacterized protein n=1 Tax=Paraburkholderia rhizosphaerae TaxID=480658 RepID=A0A4R8LWI6_9BURK|nr:hypothetical protein [Paraburkholderia rhizosphaerae]TDY52284.1 hypothetical protein BX592_105168 [Paraburkholderia rhizosphaerae]
MQTGRIHELFDTYDGLEVTVAIKKENDSGKNDQEPASRHGEIIPLSPHVSEWLKSIRWTSGLGSNNDVDWCIKSYAASDVKERRLRARWERIEGVGLRCTWIEEPDVGSDAAADTDAGRDAAGDQNEPDET